MIYVKFIFLCLFLPGKQGKQHSYQFIPEYGKVSFTCDEIFEIHACKFEKYNRTTGAFSMDFTLKVDMDDTLTVSNHFGIILFANISVCRIT